MENRNYFDNMYNDFFGVEKELRPNNKSVENSNKDNKMSDYFKRINQLYIDDESKELLKQIIEYMRKYEEHIEENYISFQIIIHSSDKETINEIVDIISELSNYFNYVKGKSYELSMYEINNNSIMNNTFMDNSITQITNLKGLDILSLETKKRLFHEIEEHVKNHINSITIIDGNENELNSFFLEKPELKAKYFNFNINGKNPTIQEYYNSIKENLKLTDKENIQLLDYLTSVYGKINEFAAYKIKIVNDISFTKKVPEIEKTKPLDEVFKELNDLVGLKKVKKVLYELVDLINLQKKDNDLKISNINLHMVFLGNPGTGKTTVARIIANILYNLKYINENKLIETSSKDLVAEYVGQTAPKTNSVIEKALGGVLFIDEAYSLASKSNDNSYNKEAVSTLIQAMENNRNNLVVIFAGYSKEMQDFLNSNSGIVSRIGYTLEFDDYSEDELTEIFNNFMKKSGFKVEKEAEDLLKKIINENKSMPNFGNARFVRNIYEKTLIKHASNTKNTKDKNKLITIVKEDINTDNLIMSK